MTSKTFCKKENRILVGGNIDNATTDEKFPPDFPIVIMFSSHTESGLIKRIKWIGPHLNSSVVNNAGHVERNNMTFHLKFHRTNAFKKPNLDIKVQLIIYHYVKPVV